MPDTRTASVAPLSTRRLWAGLWLAPLAWAAAGLLAYMVVSRSCEAGPNGLHLYGVDRPALAQALMAVVLGLGALWSLRLSYVNWRRMEASAPPSDLEVERDAGARDPRAHGISPAWGRTQFVSFAGLLASSLFILGLAYVILPTFLVNPCVQAH
jgi:hypothetical protein